MATASIIKIASIPTFQRGDGVITTLLVGADRAPDTVFTSGLTSFPPGRRAPMHSHNCGEQVTVMEGEGEVVVDGHATRVGRYDTSYIPAGKSHCFNNVGRFAVSDLMDLRRAARYADVHRNGKDCRTSFGRRQSHSGLVGIHRVRA